MSEKCPLCKGEGKSIIILKHKLTGRPYTAIDWCACMKSRLVSQAPNNKILIGLGDAYMPLDKIDPKLKFDPDNLGECPNYLVPNETSFETFCLNVKAIIMKYGFNYPAPSFYACDAIDILKKFYVQQDDKTSPSLSDTNKFDLLIFVLGTNEKNDPLKTCIAQVVYNRKMIKKPTWIYVKYPTLNSCVQEYSADLEGYLASYDRINLADVDGRVKTRHSQSKKAAEKGIFG